MPMALQRQLVAPAMASVVGKQRKSSICGLSYAHQVSDIPPQRHYIHRTVLEELIFTSFHKPHIVHCGVNKLHLECQLLCVSWRVSAIASETLGSSFQCDYQKLKRMRPGPWHENVSDDFLCNSIGGEPNRKLPLQPDLSGMAHSLMFADRKVFQ